MRVERGDLFGHTSFLDQALQLSNTVSPDALTAWQRFLCHDEGETRPLHRSPTAWHLPSLVQLKAEELLIPTSGVTEWYPALCFLSHPSNHYILPVEIKFVVLSVVLWGIQLGCHLKEFP